MLAIRSTVDLEFFARTGNPRQSQIDFLLHKSVPIGALAHDADGGGFAIGVAKVERSGQRFEFREDGVNAVLVVARDEDGEPADIVGWFPRDGWFAPLFGTLPVLGAHELLAPRLGDRLPVFLNMIDWFRAGRAGVVVLDPKRVWHPLEGRTVQAASLEDGVALRKMMERPRAKVVVVEPELEKAA